MDNLATFLFIGLIIASVISIGLPRRQADPMYRKQAAPRERQGQTEPLLNGIARDPAQARAYVHHIAVKEVATTDEAVLQSCYEIVNNRRLTTAAKVVALDALAQQTANNHPHGMAAGVLETIQDESTAVLYPHWTGAHGNFRSMKRG